MDGWCTQQRCIFLERLLEHTKDPLAAFSVSTLQEMDTLYQLSASNNAEIKFRWQSLCLQCDALFVVPQVVAFVTQQGRMKFVRPLYRALFARVPDTAVRTFQSFADGYHPIARKMIENDLHVETDVAAVVTSALQDTPLLKLTAPSTSPLTAPVPSAAPSAVAPVENRPKASCCGGKKETVKKAEKTPGVAIAYIAAGVGVLAFAYFRYRRLK